MKTKNELWDADRELFESRLRECCSPEEVNFYQNMRFKEEYEPTLSNDLIMSEKDNMYGIYIIRVNYDEYIIGCACSLANEIHTVNLSEALNVRLKDLGVDESDDTIGGWLHSINYRGVRYNNSYDDV